MHKFTICNGRFVGDFEGLYKKFNDPFLQSKKEKFEISKKAIINYCQLLQSSKKRKLKTIEIGCGFGKLSKDLSDIGFKTFGTDISKTAIKKAKLKNKKCNFFVSDLINEELYLRIKPDIFIMSEVTWYILPKLKKFIKFLKKNFKNKYLIHTLAVHHSGKQKYGKKYFTNQNGILKFFNFQYLEYGEKWNAEEGRTFFLAKIK